jgi:hypothetical protein
LAFKRQCHACHLNDPELTRHNLARHLSSAVLFAPSGKLVPTLEALDRGGACSIAGIHLSDVLSLDYGRRETVS